MTPALGALLFVAAPLAGVGLGLRLHSIWPAVGGVIVAFLTAIRGILAYRRRNFEQACPRCRRLLHRTSNEPEAPVTFACEACGIEWETGRLVPRSR